MRPFRRITMMWAYACSNNLFAVAKDNGTVLEVYEDFFTQADIDLIQKHHQQLTNDYRLQWASNIMLEATVMTSEQTQRMLDVTGIAPTSPIITVRLLNKKIHKTTYSKVLENFIIIFLLLHDVSHLFSIF